MDAATAQRGVHVVGRDAGIVVKTVGGARRAVSSAGVGWCV